MPVSTREERRQQRKYERQAAQRKAARQANVRRNVFIGAGIAVVVAVTVGIVVLAGHGGSPSAPLPGTKYDDSVTASGGLYQHIPETEPVTTDPDGHYPPVFGNHYPIWRPPGVYDVAIPEGYFVHDLEHGATVVLYNCPSGCDDAVNQLKDMLHTLPPSSQFGEVKLVVSPNTKIQTPFALLAWDYEEDLQSFDPAAVRAFYVAHLDKGPEKAAI